MINQDVTIILVEFVRISHEEQARQDNEQDRQLIDYQRYAFGVG